MSGAQPERYRPPERERTRRYRLPLALGLAFGVAVLGAVRFLVPSSLPLGLQPASGLHDDMLAAARLMAQATEAIREGRLARGLAIDPVYDPNRTGIIGLEHSSITTTYGDLEAKRTTTNPNLAALIVKLLHQAGVRRGDWIAVGASSSFPALIVASLAAARAMGLEVSLIGSLTASMWGANDPGFTFLDMFSHAREVLPYEITALSIGGELDSGGGIGEEARASLRDRITASGAVFVDEPDFEANVRLRMDLHRPPVPGARPAAFINIGGGETNLGRSAEVLKLRPGLSVISELPPPAQRGVLYAMAAEGVPVIHLLSIKTLALRYGLPWDPIPLPQPGQGQLYREADAVRGRWVYALAALVYAAVLVVVFLVFRKPAA